jgi:uncharacterized protein YcbX
MTGRIAALYRHPVKGFTPEPLDAVDLDPGAFFPCDRIWAVEDGPSGYDPAASAHLSKMKFTVLAKIPALARARTLYDDDTGALSVTVEGGGLPFHGRLTTPAGRAAFEQWLAGFLEDAAGEDSYGPLKVLAAPEHRFMDSKRGFVSVLNLESVRDLAQRIGRPVDPARFRANVLVEGWAPWSEYGLGAGRALTLGGARLSTLSDIVRCAAIHVDPRTGERDIDLVPELHAHYGHLCCGVYLSVEQGGRLAVGDAAEML